MQTHAQYKRVAPDREMRMGHLRAKEYDHLGEQEALRAQEQMAAKVIQQRYLHSDAIFRCFGPAILCRKDGAPSNYGTVHFPVPNTKAKFLVLSDTSSAPKLSKFVEKVRSTLSLPAHPSALSSRTTAQHCRAQSCGNHHKTRENSQNPPNN
jgi:hypothetical protein